MDHYFVTFALIGQLMKFNINKYCHSIKKDNHAKMTYESQKRYYAEHQDFYRQLHHNIYMQNKQQLNARRVARDRMKREMIKQRNILLC